MRSSYVGQAVAVVVGSDKYGVRDAAEQVIVEYDPLPVVVDPEKALEAGSPLVHDDFGTNETHEWTIGGGDMDAALGRRRRRSSSGGSSTTARRGRRSSRARGSPTTAAASSRSTCTSQNPHLIRLFMAGELGISEDRIRVIAPDVGGGFGVKMHPLRRGDRSARGRRASSAARSSGPRRARST